MCLVLIVGTRCPAADLPQADPTAWDRIDLDGRQVGQATVTTRVEDTLVTTEEHLRIDFGFGGQSDFLETRTVWVEDAAGVPLRYSHRSATRSKTGTIEAVNKDGVLAIESRDGRSVQSSELPLPPQAVFPHALRQRVRARPADAPAPLDVYVFDPLRLRFERQRMMPEPDVVPPDAALRSWRLLGADAAPLGILYWHAGNGRFLRSLQLAGQTLDRRPCPRACPRPDTEPPDLFVGLLRASPFHIGDALRHERLRFVLRHRQDAAAPPNTFEQDVRVHAGRIVLTICADCGREPAPSPAELDRYRLPNAWVQSDDPQIMHMARGADHPGTVPARMARLVRLVQVHMNGEVELAQYADAVTAMRMRSGDCTEFAVLLAALARARGIPTRVVAGLSYSDHFGGRRDVFVPHTWVQAWTGVRWQSFDAALGEFDSGHIALAIGDGHPDSYTGVLRATRQVEIIGGGLIKPSPQ